MEQRSNNAAVMDAQIHDIKGKVKIKKGGMCAGAGDMRHGACHGTVCTGIVV